MKILYRGQNSREWRLVESATYENEADLQHLLGESPTLLSIDEIRPETGPFA